MPCRCNSWESKSPEGPAPMIATWVRAMTGSLRCARQRSSAARGLLHDSGSDWYLSVYLSVTLMPAKLGRRHAGVSAEEAAEIGGIFESELRRDCGDRAGDVHQAAARFQSETLLHDVEGSATGQVRTGRTAVSPSSHGFPTPVSTTPNKPTSRPGDPDSRVV